MFSIAVVGGGPAGIMAAWQIAKNSSLNVHLFEKNDQLGKKILASGGGMCNYTQHAPMEEFLKHYGDHGTFLRQGLKQLDAFKTMSLLQEIGIVPFVREDGKVFPKSLDAKQWLSAFHSSLIKSGVKIHTCSRISSLSINQEGMWQLGDGQTELFDAVIIATGGLSYPALGSSGDGHNLLKGLGLTIVNPKPALSGLQLQSPLLGMEGLVLPSAKLAIRRSGKYLKMAGDLSFGPLELLITHKGLSGPLILNASRWLEPEDQLLVNWPGWSVDHLEAFLLESASLHGKRALSTVLESLPLPKRFIQELLRLLGIDGGKAMANLTKKIRNEVIEGLTAYKIDQFSVIGFHQAMATAGGLELTEVSNKTMAVKTYKNLYVIGELLDIDGDTGGYNIQAALTTGYVAAHALLRQLRQV